MSRSKPIRDHSKSLTIDFDKMTTERMLEFLILRDILQKGVVSIKKTKCGIDTMY